MEYRLRAEELKERAGELRAGDRVYLSGTVYTARDQAHMALFRLMDAGDPLPVDLRGAAIYYAGPTPGRGDMPTLACGPTTSGRMDKFTPRLLDMGLAAMIGKGPRSAQVREAIVRNGAVYLCATGGAGALIAKSIVSLTEIAFPELGCESLKRLEVENMPLIVGIDAHGGDIFEEAKKAAAQD